MKSKQRVWIVESTEDRDVGGPGRAVVDVWGPGGAVIDVGE